MNDDAGNRRWITREACASISALLDLPEASLMQDWDLACADPRRIEEFLECYEQRDLNDDERFALMALLIASFDMQLQNGDVDDLRLQRLRRHLLENYTLHRFTIHNWCLFAEADPGNVFCITPFLRKIWHACA